MNPNTPTDETDENPSSPDTTNSNRKCTYWIRDDAREFITDPDGQIVNLARLTAYAEHGEAIYDAEAHHELSSLKIDAPTFLDALPREEHAQVNHGEVQEVDGFPLIRAGP